MTKLLQENMSTDTAINCAKIKKLFSGNINQDDLILEQQRQIEKEVATAVPLIGKKEPVSLLAEEYKNDLVYIQKVTSLQNTYSHMRKMRPDGNCFFRAFIFSYLESLIGNEKECERFQKFVVESKEKLIANGVCQFTLEDFYNKMIEILEIIKQSTNKEDLENIFNKDDGTADYLVVYMRLLTSAQLQQQAEFYKNFLEGNQSVKEFCQQEVEPMYRESDHIHIHALTASIQTGARVVYMDRGGCSNVSLHDFPENCSPSVHLLYRPGHYDVLYPVRSTTAY